MALTCIPPAGKPPYGITPPGIPATGVPSSGIPTVGAPVGGIPSTGIPSLDVPATGIPSSGVIGAGAGPDAFTMLLVHFDGTNGSTSFADTSTLAHVLTPTNATVTTASPKFGSGSGDFSAGVASAISVSAPADFNFAAGQFTVEAWVYIPGATGGIQAVVSQWGATNFGWFFGLSSGLLAFYWSTIGSDNPNLTAAFSPTLNTWYHLAVDKDASVLRMYINGGIVLSTPFSATIFASTQPCVIGNDNTAGRNWPGRIDELRVSKGIARYAGAFTPPSAPF